MAVFFISETYLKDNTPANLNVDTKDVYAHVGTAQDVYIQDVIGSKLYDELKTAVAASTISSAQADLLDKIQPAQVWWSIYLALPWINYKVKNKSVQKSNSENGVAAELPEMKWLRDDLKNRAEYYSQRLKDFLFLNSQNYPSYTNPDLPVLPQRGNQFDSGMFMERKGGQFPDDCCPPFDRQDMGIHPIN